MFVFIIEQTLEPLSHSVCEEDAKLPSEERNLAKLAEHAAVVTEMKALLRKACPNPYKPPPAPPGKGKGAGKKKQAAK